MTEAACFKGELACRGPPPMRYNGVRRQDKFSTGIHGNCQNKQAKAVSGFATVKVAVMGEYQIPHWLYALIVVLALFVGLPGGIYLLRCVKRGTSAVSTATTPQRRPLLHQAARRAERNGPQRP